MPSVPFSVVPAQSTKRIPRRPTHNFNLKTEPYQIQPFLIAPVLAGETMKNLLMQARVVTDPINSPLIGWWQEYYFFYVKLRDLADRDTIETALLDLGSNLSSISSATDVDWTYHRDGVDWVKKCHDRVVDEYFRDQGETITQHTVGGIPAAQINGTDWTESVYDASEITTDAISSTVDTDFGDFEDRYRTWEFLRQQAMTELSFEDYLRTFGVHLPANEGMHKPELIRFIREWSYPSNTIDPSDGSPTSAVSWSISERADKDRFFKEPGFLFGVTITRPKVYKKDIDEAGVHLLDDALSWLPAMLKDDVATSLKQLAAATGPLATKFGTSAYWVDVRDLFIHGDQFRNYATTETGVSMIDLVATDENESMKYATEASIRALFVDTVTPKYYVRQDGVVSLNILGTQQDYT